MDNILFIPGIANPVSEINSLLFGAGQQGTFIAPSLTPSLITGSTFGTGVETLTDLSPRNNPFSQATPSSRGAWFREPKTGRRNLFVNTAFVNAVSGTPGTTPTGWLRPFNASPIVYDAANETLRVETSATREFFEQEFVIPTSSTRLYSITVDVGTETTFSNVFWTSNDPVSGASRVVRINGVVGSSVTVLPIGSYNLEIELTTTTTAWTTRMRFGFGVLSNATGFATFRRPQFEIGTTRTAYQRVGATAFDVTESGQRDCYGVRTDGIDDRYNTTNNVNFTATNKMTVFAAVRKRSDAARGVIVSHNENLDSRFSLESPDTDPTFRALYRSRGTATAAAIATSAAFTAPVNMVMTGESDIGSPFARLRINGASVANVTVNQGTGNYANAALQLFHIASSGHFNGDMFAIIIAGGSYPLSTIQRVERILSRITPTVNL